MRREVDVLTLSATPIPRTLHLSLVGIRDLCVIETPPEARLPIQTRIAEDDDGLVRDAISRELDRGGQVFYVHNRVETIEAAAERVRRLVPGRARRHRSRPDGRGHARAGDARLLRRQVRRPRLHDHHRVGPRHPEREHHHHRARRHLRPGAALPAARTGRPIRPARPRLPAPPARDAAVAGRPQAAARHLQRLRPRRRLPDRAVRPRDPRGRATSSAPSSTASWRRSGFEMYTRLLAEAVDMLRGRRPPPEPSPIRLDLPGSAYLPDDYVSSSGAKLEAYRRFAQVRSRGRCGRPARRPARPIRADPAAGRGPFHRRPRAAGGRGGRRAGGPGGGAAR